MVSSPTLAARLLDPALARSLDVAADLTATADRLRRAAADAGVRSSQLRQARERLLASGLGTEDQLHREHSCTAGGEQSLACWLQLQRAKDAQRDLQRGWAYEVELAELVVPPLSSRVGSGAVDLATALYRILSALHSYLGDLAQRIDHRRAVLSPYAIEGGPSTVRFRQLAAALLASAAPDNALQHSGDDS